MFEHRAFVFGQLVSFKPAKTILKRVVSAMFSTVSQHFAIEPDTIHELLLLHKLGDTPPDMSEDLSTMSDPKPVSTAQRMRQRGAEANAQIITALVDGVKFKTPDSMVVVVEWHPQGIADWLRAVRCIQDKKLAGMSRWLLEVLGTRQTHVIGD